MKEGSIIDIHAHIFHEKLAPMVVNFIGTYYGAKMQGEGTAEELIKSGEKTGVVKYVVFTTATKAEEVQNFNDFIARIVKKNKCFVGFGSLHPKMTGAVEEVDRVISLGLKGIKLHPEFQKFSIDDEDMMNIYGAVEGRLPILMHLGDEKKTSSSPQRLLKVLEKFPHLTVVASHLGGYKMWDESLKYLVGKNVYLDTSSSLPFLEKEKAVEIIRSHGVNRVIFGTDYPMWNHEGELERFNSLGLEREERELILWKNAKKLLNI